jgi:hypothetical protein
MEYSNELTNRIFTLLTPLLGRVMSDATLKVQCKKIGASLDTLRGSDLPVFSRNLEMGLVIFVGSDKAKEISSRIQKLAS